MSFWSERRVKKPRKAKHCYWCGEACLAGEPKLVVSGVWDGEFFSDSWHPECNAAREAWQVQNKGEEELPWEGEMQRGKPISREELEVQP
jgi:hypothetical protein